MHHSQWHQFGSERDKESGENSVLQMFQFWFLTNGSGRAGVQSDDLEKKRYLVQYQIFHLYPASADEVISVHQKLLSQQTLFGQCGVANCPAYQVLTKSQMELLWRDCVPGLGPWEIWAQQMFLVQEEKFYCWKAIRTPVIPSQWKPPSWPMIFHCFPNVTLHIHQDRWRPQQEEKWWNCDATSLPRPEQEYQVALQWDNRRFWRTPCLWSCTHFGRVADQCRQRGHPET